MDEQRAAEELARAAAAPPPGCRPAFRLWHFPPGGTWRSWTLFLDAGGGLLREARWDGQMSVRETPLGEEDTRGLRAQAAYLSLPEGDIESDLAVTEYGIEGFAPGAPVVRWSSPVPPTLRAIAAWHSRLRARFAALLDAGPPPG